MSVRISSPSQDPQPNERVSAAFEKLKASASELNAVSDELAKPIQSVDATLQGLNLGVSAWVEVAGDVDPDNGFYWDRALGYDKVAGTWGLAIRAEAGPLGVENPEEVWRFSDAPRSYRLESLDKLPELLEKLVETANKTTAELRSKIALTKQVATTIGQMAASRPARRK